VERAEVRIPTGQRLVTDLTTEVRSFCRGKGDGLCHLLVPHATAGLALMETGAGSEADLGEALSRLLPRNDELYGHRHGSSGHGADHLLPALVSPSLVLAVTDGEPALGSWQSVVIVDANLDNPERRLLLSFLPG
jgi:secondary thiamine-phosphate synthase enzyme